MKSRRWQPPGMGKTPSPGVAGRDYTAKVAAELAAQSGTAFALAAANLVATGLDVSPSTFNRSLSDVPPTPGVVP